MTNAFSKLVQLNIYKYRITLSLCYTSGTFKYPIQLHILFLRDLNQVVKNK